MIAKVTSEKRSMTYLIQRMSNSYLNIYQGTSSENLREIFYLKFDEKIYLSYRITLNLDTANINVY